MEFRTDGVRSGEAPMYILNYQKWKYLGLTLIETLLFGFNICSCKYITLLLE
jgi:hypothetical protein